MRNCPTPRNGSRRRKIAVGARQTLAVSRCEGRRRSVARAALLWALVICSVTGREGTEIVAKHDNDIENQLTYYDSVVASTNETIFVSTVKNNATTNNTTKYNFNNEEVSPFEVSTESTPSGSLSIHSTITTKLMRKQTQWPLVTRMTKTLDGKYGHGWTTGRDRTGPYFGDGPGPFNITALAGTTLFIDCCVALLHDKTVTWTRRRGSRLQLLTVGRAAWSADARISLSFRYPDNWRLSIAPVQHPDAGQYECSVATHPPRQRLVNLLVTGPTVQILDESNRSVSERYYLAGSFARLVCFAKELSVPSEDIVWSRDGRNLTDEDDVVLAVDSIKRLGWSTITFNTNNRTHAGLYTCKAGSATAVVSVHILRGVSVLPNTGMSSGNYCQPSYFILILTLLASIRWKF